MNYPITVEIPFSDIAPGLLNILMGGIVSGEVGYQAYGNAAGWVNYLGRPMPPWDKLPETIQRAWHAAAYAIVEAACQAGEKCRSTDECTCEHTGLLHYVAEADGSGRRCCIDGCVCGSGQ